MRGRYVWCVAQYDDGETHNFSVPETKLQRGDYILKSLASESQRYGLLPPGEIAKAHRGGR